MSLKEKIDLEKIILELFILKNEIKIQDVICAAKMSIDASADRRAIQRAFKKMIEKKIILDHGNARSRAYTLIRPKRKLSSKPPKVEFKLLFKEIQLTKKSQILLKYISQKIEGRSPAGYSQNFLNSYKPNQTFH